MAALNLKDLILIFLLSWSRGASARDDEVTSSCKAPQAYPGDAGTILCSFNVDLSQEQKPFTVYRYPVGSSSDVVVLDCFWLNGTIECTVMSGYKFDKNVSSQFTLTILNASEEFVGRYECSAEPIRASDKESCNFTLKLQTPETAQTTSSGKGTFEPDSTSLGKQENSEKDNTTGIVLGLVIPAVVGAVGGVLLYMYWKRRKRTPHTEQEDPLMHYDNTERTFLLVGGKGTGKSSLGNTLLGRDMFETGCQMYTITTKAQVERSEGSEHPKIKVVDTPDIHESNFEDKQRREEVEDWKTLAAPGPDAILLVIDCSDRYTMNEYEIYQQLKALWGDSDSFCKRLIVAFTFGDRRQNTDITEEISSQKLEGLNNILKDASGRYVVFNNEASPDEKLQKVKYLLDIVRRMNQ